MQINELKVTVGEVCEGYFNDQINLQKCCRQGCAEAVEKDVWKYEQIQKKSRLSVYSFLPRRTGKIMRGKPL